jgi:transcription factor CON7
MNAYSEELHRNFRMIDLQEPLDSRPPTPNILDLIPISQSPLDVSSSRDSYNSSPSRPESLELSNCLDSTPPVSRSGSPDFTSYGRRASRSSLNLLPHQNSSNPPRSRSASLSSLGSVSSNYPTTTTAASSDSNSKTNSGGGANPGGESSSDTRYSCIALPGNAVKKRPRRRYNELERIYQCSWPDCSKAYGTLNHLNAHVTMQKHGAKRSPGGKQFLSRRISTFYLGVVRHLYLDVHHILFNVYLSPFATPSTSVLLKKR